MPSLLGSHKADTSVLSYCSIRIIISAVSDEMDSICCSLGLPTQLAIVQGQSDLINVVLTRALLSPVLCVFNELQRHSVVCKARCHFVQLEHSIAAWLTANQEGDMNTQKKCRRPPPPPPPLALPTS